MTRSKPAYSNCWRCLAAWLACISAACICEAEDRNALGYGANTESSPTIVQQADDLWLGIPSVPEGLAQSTVVSQGGVASESPASAVEQPVVAFPAYAEASSSPSSSPPAITAPASSVASSVTSASQTSVAPFSVGYDGGFVIASQAGINLPVAQYPYSLVINGYGQLRETVFESQGTTPDLNQLQLKRARLVFSGHAFNPDFRYYIQLDGRSSSGDALRILDYYLNYDFGHRHWNLAEKRLGFRTGLYKMPFSMSRGLSGKELQFADRSMASMFFDVNRSLAWGLYGELTPLQMPLTWEVAIFNGLVTGGAETGSSGTLDNNNAFSARVTMSPIGDWETGGLADLTIHERLATRVGVGTAFTQIDRVGTTEFNALRVVDSGAQLSSLLPNAVDHYSVALYAADAGIKYRGASLNLEYYFRNVNGFHGAQLPDLFDHGLWLQGGYILIPEKLEVLARWSRVQGNSGTLGNDQRSSEEIAAGFVRYFKRQNVKLTVDATYLDGAPVNSTALDISQGDIGWLCRTQLQFSF
ncbi:porin family protein [Aureliella helgolandensis]|uniref:Phosphate-selective porin O and P n=1 Tax=Aureliella helgolandensis TaxID=2527968 RepID=A0A518G947_9BACT|nr:porin [Aureliella helgolandensis]QDV25125.1 Phosphate-selective porin O and P [Aureliella helgolandensis]